MSLFSCASRLRPRDPDRRGPAVLRRRPHYRIQRSISDHDLLSLGFSRTRWLVVDIAIEIEGAERGEQQDCEPVATEQFKDLVERRGIGLVLNQGNGLREEDQEFCCT